MSKHRRPADRRRPTLVLAALGVAALTTLAASSPAIAAKGGGGGKGAGGGGGKNNSATGSFSLRMLDPNDPVINYGDDVTFDVQSTATWPMVQVLCYQGDTVVYRHGAGFYGGYPFSQVFDLAGWAWPGGAASCNAELYSANADGSYRSHLADLPFYVYD